MKNTLFIFSVCILFAACRYPVSNRIYQNQARYTAKNTSTFAQITDNNATENIQSNSTIPTNLSTKLTLLFDYNVFKLSTNNISELETFYKNLSEAEKVQTKYFIEGHADQSGSESYNLTLSRYRAESVKHHLNGLGIPSENLIILPRGESQPIAGESESFKNRRVSVYILNL